MIYLFVIVRANSEIASFQRDLPNDFDAFGWIGNEFLQSGDRLEAFRNGSAEPFARREFGADVEVLG